MQRSSKFFVSVQCTSSFASATCFKFCQIAVISCKAHYTPVFVKSLLFLAKLTTLLFWVYIQLYIAPELVTFVRPIMMIVNDLCVFVVQYNFETVEPVHELRKRPVFSQHFFWSSSCCSSVAVKGAA